MKRTWKGVTLFLVFFKLLDLDALSDYSEFLRNRPWSQACQVDIFHRTSIIFTAMNSLSFTSELKTR